MDFNLTTQQGRKDVLETLDKWSWLVFPHVWLAKKVLDFFSPTDIAREQRRTAIELIRAGRDNNVDEMRITVDQTVGVDIGAQIDGIPVRAKIGKNGQMVLEVKYKNT